MGSGGIDASLLDAGPGDDAASPGPDPLHLAPGDGATGTALLTLTGSVTIDTTGPTLTGATLPAGDSFDVRPQVGGGPELAVLHVRALTVLSGAVVRIVGTRPLVIVAASAITVDGTLDAGARRATPGAGGSLPGAGAGAGIAGAHGSNESDSGGGGAGFGKAGGMGHERNFELATDGPAAHGRSLMWGVAADAPTGASLPRRPRLPRTPARP